MIKQRSINLGIYITLILTLVGGGGGGSGATPTINTVTISGVVTYTDYNVVSGTGIDYSNPLEKPIRGAIVDLY